ncbi:hypothetical protein [Chryseobacterium cucumeris]|uniref:hypothetical protein n=1 Tax=Chryseobacterium cucumeris TaxID=1813611 RepID=UPI003D994528
MPDILRNIEHTFLYFASIHHVENELFSLTILLEYYQNIENHDKIDEINTIFERYKAEYGNIDFSKKIDFTTHEGTFVSEIIRIKNDIDARDREKEILRQEIIDIDKEEHASVNINRHNKNTIYLFPMGYFLVPKDKSDVLFEILEIVDDSLKKQIIGMLEIAIPIINCYVDKITNEGPLRGEHEFLGLESYRKMRRIRKAMDENNFVRTEIKFS